MKRNLNEYWVWKRGVVVGLSPRDAFYEDRKEIIGVEGWFKRSTSLIDFYSSGEFRHPSGRSYNFFAAQFKEV